MSAADTWVIREVPAAWWRGRRITDLTCYHATSHGPDRGTRLVLASFHCGSARAIPLAEVEVEAIAARIKEHTPVSEQPITSYTTSTGTDIYVTGDNIVTLDNPAAPEDMRECEAGRIIDGGFQPAPFAAWALLPETLRLIADLIEDQA